jgi:hypothetical protein
VDFYGLVDLCSYSNVIYMCYVSVVCDIVIYICLSMWKAKKKHKVTSLPRGATGKGPFAECSWQLVSATLGTNFPSSGVPSFAVRICQGGSTKKVFF